MSGLNGYFSTKEEELDLHKLVDRITFIPLFLTGYIFYLGSIVLISIIFPLYPAVALPLVALLSTFYAITLRLLKKLWQLPLPGLSTFKSQINNLVGSFWACQAYLLHINKQTKIFSESYCNLDFMGT